MSFWLGYLAGIGTVLLLVAAFGIYFRLFVLRKLPSRKLEWAEPGKIPMKR